MSNISSLYLHVPFMEQSVLTEGKSFHEIKKVNLSKTNFWGKITSEIVLEAGASYCVKSIARTDHGFSVVINHYVLKTDELVDRCYAKEMTLLVPLNGAYLVTDTDVERENRV